MCHFHRNGIAISTAATGSRDEVEMGWCAGRRRTQAGGGASGSASAAGAARVAASVPRNAEGREGRSVAPLGKARWRVGAKLAGGLRAPEVPARSLLHPGRPRPPDRRGRECAGPGLWAQGDRRALRARRESGVPPRRPRTSGSLPRTRTAHTTRGPERDCLRSFERPSPSRQARTHAARDDSNRSGIFRAVVLRLANGRVSRQRSSRRCSAAYVAPERRLAPTWTHRQFGGSGNRVTSARTGNRERTRHPSGASSCPQNLFRSRAGIASARD